jgi:hypothetical protein
LHAAGKHQHPSIVTRSRPGGWLLLCRHAASQADWHQGSQRPTERQQSGESFPSRNGRQKHAPEETLSERPRYNLLYVVPADVEQAPVTDA